MTKAAKIVKSNKFDNLTIYEVVGVMHYLFTCTCVERHSEDNVRVGEMIAKEYKHIMQDMHLVFNHFNMSGVDRSVLEKCEHHPVYDDVLIEIISHNKFKIQYITSIKNFTFYSEDGQLIKLLVSNKVIRKFKSYYTPSNEYAITDAFVNKFITDISTVNNNINLLSSAIRNIIRSTKIQNIISSNKRKQSNND